MIPLSSLEYTISESCAVNIIDKTDYESGTRIPFRLQDFKLGARIILVYHVETDTTVVYCTFSQSFLNANFAIDTTYDTEINGTNSGNFVFEIPNLQNGNYEVYVVSIPAVTDNVGGLIMNLGEVVFISDGSSYSLYSANIDNPSLSGAPYTDFTEIPLNDNFAEIPESYINKVTFEVQCIASDSPYNCLMSKVKSAFCEKCKCDSFCKKKDSLDLMKGTLLMMELNILDKNSDEYAEKKVQYEAIIETLCRC